MCAYQIKGSGDQRLVGGVADSRTCLSDLVVVRFTGMPTALAYLPPELRINKLSISCVTAYCGWILQLHV